MPINEICQPNLLGDVQVLTQAVQALCEQEVPIPYFSQGSWFYGVTQGLGVKNIYLRREQFRLADVPAFCLRLARALTASQVIQLREILLAGPLAAGFSSDLWSCRRVAEVVRREYRISYQPDHLGRILHELGFSPQKPQRRAHERDEAAIQRWRREDWPRIKKGDAAGKLPLSCSTKPASFCNL